MTVILHLSDTHFGTERAEVRDALLQLARETRPDLAILSGDITQRARYSQFAAARRFLDALATPARLLIPGNHDIPLFNLFARVFDPYRHYRQLLGPELQPQFSNQEVLVIGVNTTRPWRHADGEVSAKQIAHVSGQLQRAAPGQLRIVVVHQPVFVERASERKNLLHGHRQAVQAWAAAGANLILSGHIHLAYIRNLANQVGGVMRPLWTVSAGTAISRRVRAGKENSVNLIRYDAATPHVCLVERLDYDAACGRFVSTDSSTLTLV